MFNRKNIFSKIVFSIIAIISIVIYSNSNSYSLDYSTITFDRISSATPAQIRIGEIRGQLASDGNVKIQTMPLPTPKNYSFTDTYVYTIPQSVTAIEIQVDEDTKMYLGSDLDNYLMLYSASPRIYSVK